MSAAESSRRESPATAAAAATPAALRPASASVAPTPTPAPAAFSTDMHRAFSPSGAHTSPTANSLPASNDAIHLRVLSPSHDSDSSSESEDDDDRASAGKQKPSSLPGTSGVSRAGTPHKRRDSPLMRTDSNFARAFGMAPLLSDRMGGGSELAPMPATLLMPHSPPPQMRPRLSSSTPNGKKPPSSTFELRSPFSPSPVILNRSLKGSGSGSASDEDENKFSPSSCLRTLPPHQYVDSFEEDRSEPVPAPVSVQMSNLAGGQLYIHETPLVQPRTLQGSHGSQGSTPRVQSGANIAARKLIASSPDDRKQNLHHAPPNLLVLPQAALAVPAHSRSSSSTHSASNAWVNPATMPSPPSSAAASPAASPTAASIPLPPPNPIVLPPANATLAVKTGESNGTSEGADKANERGDGTRSGVSDIKPPSPFHHAPGLRSPGASPEPPAGLASGGSLTGAPEPAAPKKKTPCLRSCSFASMIAVVAALVLAAAVLVVGWIGREATVDIATTMAGITRDTLFLDTRRDVSVAFALSLRDIDALAIAAQEKLPSFHNASTLANTTGWLSVLTSTACSSRQLHGMGIVNQRRVGMFVTAATNQSSAHAGAEDFSHGLAGHELAVIVGSVPEDTGADAVWQLYHPQAIHPPIMSRYSPILHACDPLDSQESLSEIARYLGAGSPFDFEKLRATDNIDLQVGRRMRRENITSFWGAPTQFMPRLDNLQPEEPHSPTTLCSMRVYSRIESGWIQPSDAGSLGDAPLAVGMIDLRLFTHSLHGDQLGENGLAFLLTPNGLVVSSSNLAYNHSTVTDDDGTTVIGHVLPILRGCRLVTSTPVDSLTAPDAIDMSEAICEGRFRWDDKDFHLYAQLLDQASTGLPFTVVLVTHREDFYGQRLHEALILAVWSSSLTLAVGVLLISLAASFLARPLGSVIRFMGRVRQVAALPSSAQKHSKMQRLLQKWDRYHGYKHHSQVAQAESPRMSSRSRSMSHGADGRGPAPRRWCSVQSKEVALIERSFGEFLQTWASYDELEALNHSKRQFIRYIFHEVRVPFNALVLGIEQLQADVSPHQALLADAMDTLAILHEQTEVVTHILNDVLSLQKIEDGALTLEFQTFCLERMIRATLYSFKAPCQERQLKIKLNLANLNQHMQSKMDAALDAPLPPHASAEDQRRQTALMACRSELRFGIFGDHHRLRQVLSNYASNAIKFSRKAGDDIRVTLFFEGLELTDEFRHSMHEMQARKESKDKQAAATPGDGGAASAETLNAQFALESDALLDHFAHNPVATVGVRVSVVDQGVGIPSEHIKNLFTPYMQINAGTLQKSKGTGLGLSVSKSIMSLHGGSVGCHSIEGQGAEFTFSIPCLEVRMLTSGVGDSVRNSAVTTPITAPRTSPKPDVPSLTVRTRQLCADAKQAQTNTDSTASAEVSVSAAMPTASSTAAAGSTSSCKGPVTHVTRAGLSVSRRGSNTPSKSTLPRHLAQQNANTLALLGLASVAQPAVTVESDLEAINSAAASGSAASPRDQSQSSSQRTSTFVVVHSPPVPSAQTPLTVSRPLESPTPALAQESWSIEGLPASPSGPSPASTIRVGSPSPREVVAPIDASKRRSPRPSSSGVGSAGLDRAPMKRQASRDDELAPPSHANLSVMTSPQQSTMSLLSVSSPNILTPTAMQELATAPSSTWPSTRSLSDTGSSPSPSNMASTTVHCPFGRTTAAPTASSTPIARSGVRVLVVEDSAPNRKLLCALLTRLGCKVSSAEHGEECINLMKPVMSLSPSRRTTLDGLPSSTESTPPEGSEAADFPAMHGAEPSKHNLPDQMPFDIILMDNSMPVMDGVTATRILRSAGLTLPIVGVTGNTLEEDVRAFLAAGATEILSKPVSTAKLEKVLRDYTAYGPGRRIGGSISVVASSGAGGKSSPTAASTAAPPSLSSSVASGHS